MKKKKCAKVFADLIKVLPLFPVAMLIALPSLAIADAPPAVNAIIDVNPNTFNLASKGKWATIHIEFPENSEYDVGKIDVGSVTLSVNGYNIPAGPMSEIGDYDSDDLLDMMVKFDRQKLQLHMFAGVEELTVSGSAGDVSFAGSDTVSVVADGATSAIIQTSDIHHHASGYGPFKDYTPDGSGDDIVTGGFARLATVIGGIKSQQAMAGVPTILVDSGDFFMGTTYDLTADDPIILKFFTLMEYDAITLGNHEFDWTPIGLYGLLKAGLEKNDPYFVPIVASNTIPDGVADTADDDIEFLMDYGTIVNQKVIQLDNGVKVGLIGLMGKGADQDAPMASPITFDHDYALIQGYVDDLRNNDGVDVVIALSHSGVNSYGEGKDAELAENVKGIDIIASGHTHTATPEPFLKGDSSTIIFSPGQYGEWVSHLQFTYNKELGRIVGFEFNLNVVDLTNWFIIWEKFPHRNFKIPRIFPARSHNFKCCRKNIQEIFHKPYGLPVTSQK